MKIPRSIAVIDIGATNTKLFHLGPDLRILDQREQTVDRVPGPPYAHINAEDVLLFAAEVIQRFDAVVPVDAIVPTSHGSALALMDANGALALPIMSYLAEVPDDVAAAYDEIAPSYREVLSPTHPLALSLGKQLLWQETEWPDAFAMVAFIVPYAQYIGFRLTGVAASEVTSLGAQTQLWAPVEGRYASLVRDRGWDRLMAPIRPAGEVLGIAENLRLNGYGRVHCGLHDSNANYLRYAPLAPLCLLSTGTWIVAFESVASIADLRCEMDQVSNSTVSGDPIACARFMGGEEYARIADPTRGGTPSLAAVQDLIDRNIRALPSFTDSGGPLPWTGGKGRIAGDCTLNANASASLASLYAAQMTALTLDGLAGAERVIVDGVFAQNDVYLRALAGLLPERRIYRSLERYGTATGAATLALPDPAMAPLPDYAPVGSEGIVGLEDYHSSWKSDVEAEHGRPVL